MTNPSPEWHLRAACRGKDTDVFFSDARRNREYVRGLCADCPVRGDCLESALREDETYRLIPFGYRGGATAEERAALLRARANTTTTRSAA
jgi:hypothetical protein